MPRRRALTEAQLENLLALPIAEPDLVQHWTLSDTDFAAIDQRRRDRNRIGFALQLCALRYPGRLLRPGELIPAEALRFIAEQLGADPDALTSYATRFQTRYEQLDDLRDAFGFADLTPARRRDILKWLLPVALTTTSAFGIAQALMTELRRRCFIAPGPFVIEQLVAAILVVAERHVAGQLTRGLSSTQTAALHALLASKDDTPMSVRARDRGGVPGRAPCPAETAHGGDQRQSRGRRVGRRQDQRRRAEDHAAQGDHPGGGGEGGRTALRHDAERPHHQRAGRRASLDRVRRRLHPLAYGPASRRPPHRAHRRAGRRHQPRPDPHGGRLLGRRLPQARLDRGLAPARGHLSASLSHPGQRPAAPAARRPVRDR